MLLSVEHITKYHNEKCIVKDISFAIEEHDKIALIGINGTGKTTLLKILYGSESYQEGSILRKNGLRIAYLPQNPQFLKDEQIMDYMKRNLRDDHPIEEFEIKAVLSKLGIFQVNDKIAPLSGGQKKRVALAAAILQPCDLLILDEPTNHLDHDMVDWLEKYLRKLNRALIMVTHDRYFLDRVTNRILEIDHAQVYMIEGNYTKFLEVKAKREEMNKASERKRQSILRKEFEWVHAGVQARGTKSRERLERFEKLSEQAMIPKENNSKLDILTSRLGKKTIEINQISKGYDHQLLFHDFSYHVKRHDRIGILGANGCGKSTLLQVLAKEIEPDSGTVVHGETVRIAYFKQGTDEMDETMRVIDYIKDTGNEIETKEGVYSASQMLERFLFDSQLQYTKINRLSGGERRRLYLLQILMQKPNILFLDEATNDLDIQTLMILEDYLDQFNGAIIAVSHDRYFLDRICDKVFVFQSDHTLKQYIGGYSMYLEHAKRHVLEEQPKQTEIKKQRHDGNLKLTSKEKKALETMDGDMEQIQLEIQMIDQQMMDANDDYEKIQKLAKIREEKNDALEQMMEYWMELDEKQQQILASRK